MGSKGKILIIDDGHFDLTAYKWDDQLFSDILAEKSPGRLGGEDVAGRPRKTSASDALLVIS